jgi:hypothetical protein
MARSALSSGEMQSRRPPIIIDIEASGFGAQSYPIEIGVVLDDGRKYCSLIQPARGWTHWDQAAEAVHGITRATLLAHGRPVFEVAGTLNELLRGRTAYTDGWVVDRPWLDRLYESASMRCEFTLSSLEMILSEQQMDAWATTKQHLLAEQDEPRHRASYDALVVQETFQRTRAVSRTILGAG